MSVRKIRTENGESKWEVRVHENGRGSKRINRRFDRKVEAEEFMQDLKDKLRAQKYASHRVDQKIEYSERTFHQEALEWLEQGKLRFSTSHLKRANGVLTELLPILGPKRLSEIKTKDLTDIQLQEKQRGSANATANRKTEVVMAILNFAVRNQRLAFNPAVGFSKFSKSKQEMQFWDQKETMSFLSFMEQKYKAGSAKRWVYVVYLLAINTGIRAGEIWGLWPSDLTAEKDALWIRRQFNRVTQNFEIVKGKKPRFVPANPSLAYELDQLINCKRLKSAKTIFQNKEGQPICHDNFVARTFDQDLKEWGGRRVRFHDLRHTAATLMIKHKVDLKTVKEICGHASIMTTMEYVHMLSGSVQEVAATFGIVPSTNKSSAKMHESAGGEVN